MDFYIASSAKLRSFQLTDEEFEEFLTEIDIGNMNIKFHEYQNRTYYTYKNIPILKIGG